MSARWSNVGFRAVVVGLLFAAGIFVRPGWLPFALVVPVVFPWLVPRRQRLTAAVAGLVMMVSMTCGLLPWAYRNSCVVGRWVFLTTWGGPSLYDGLRPGADGASDMSFVDQERLFDTLSETEFDDHYRRRAVAFAKDNPAEVVRLAGLKLVRFWNVLPNAGQFRQPSGIALTVVSFVLVFLPLPLAIPAVRDQTLSIALLSAPLIYFCVLHLVFVSSLRYRLPAEYPLCVLSAVGLRHGWHRFWTTKPGNEALPT